MRNLEIAEKRLGKERTEASLNEYLSTPEKTRNPYLPQQNNNHSTDRTLASSTISYENRRGTHAIKVIHNTALDLSKKSQVRESNTQTNPNLSKITVSSIGTEEKSHRTRFNLNLTEVTSSPQATTKLLEFSPEPQKNGKPIIQVQKRQIDFTSSMQRSPSPVKDTIRNRSGQNSPLIPYYQKSERELEIPVLGSKITEGSKENSERPQQTNTVQTFSDYSKTNKNPLTVTNNFNQVTVQKQSILAPNYNALNTNKDLTVSFHSNPHQANGQSAQVFSTEVKIQNDLVQVPGRVQSTTANVAVVFGHNSSSQNQNSAPSTTQKIHKISEVSYGSPKQTNTIVKLGVDSPSNMQRFSSPVILNTVRSLNSSPVKAFPEQRSKFSDFFTQKAFEVLYQKYDFGKNGIIHSRYLNDMLKDLHNFIGFHYDSKISGIYSSQAQRLLQSDSLDKKSTIDWLGQANIVQI